MKIWIMRVAVTCAIAVVGSYAGQRVYWMLPPTVTVFGRAIDIGQPDPKIIEHMHPVPNLGVDADGLTFNQWVDLGRPGADWTPAELPPLRPGEAFYVLRDVEFRNKVQTSEVGVTEVYLGCSEAAGSWHRGPQYKVPTRTLGRVRRNFKVTLPADIQPGCWRFQVAVEFYKNPYYTAYRAVFEDVVIQVGRP